LNLFLGRRERGIEALSEPLMKPHLGELAIESLEFCPLKLLRVLGQKIGMRLKGSGITERRS